MPIDVVARRENSSGTRAIVATTMASDLPMQNSSSLK